MIFQPKKTFLYQGLKLEKIPIFRFRKFFRALFLILTLSFFLLILLEKIWKVLPKEFLSFLIGGGSLSFGVFLFFFELNLFFESKIKNPSPRYLLEEVILRGEEFNLASFLDFDSLKISVQALKFAKRKKFKEASQEIFLFLILKSNLREVEFIFGRAGILREELEEILKKELVQIKNQWRPHFEKVIFEAIKVAKNRKKERAGIGDILIALSETCSVFKNFLILNDLKKEDIKNLADWYERVEKRIRESRKFWEYENLLKKGSIGKDWAAGYTITLDNYSLDLRERLEKTGFQEVVGHQKEINQVERILQKKGINNVLLVGEPGVGRKSVVRAIVQRAFLGKSLPSLNYKRILNFNIGWLLSQVNTGAQFDAILEECFSQAVEAGNVILVIEEIENFLSTPQEEKVDISEILARYLPLSEFQIIAITTYQSLHTILERKRELLNLFEKVEVEEISEKETLEFLENFVPFFEKKSKRFISYKALREILRLSSRYLPEIPFPEKTLRLLDESINYLTFYTQEKILTESHIKRVISEKVDVPLEELEKKERELLLNLEELIHQRIINQEEAIKEISSALRRARAQIQLKSGPIGSFLFLGPTGVGKTETCKALAQFYFGREQRMIRLDMSEFQEIGNIKRLIGGEGREGLLTTPVRENPFSLVLLDEIEKAHPDILNLFLQILDEGWVTAGDGRKVDFKNTIIIATSNAGAELIREDINANKKLDIVKEDLIDYLLREEIFRPEFINRFDGVIVFKPLTRENLLAICHLMLKKLRENLKDKGIIWEIEQELKEKIVELSYSPEFGARQMQRVIQQKIEDLLAQALLSGKIKRGDKIKIKVEENKFILVKEKEL